MREKSVKAMQRARTTKMSPLNKYSFNLLFKFGSNKRHLLDNMYTHGQEGFQVLQSRGSVKEWFWDAPNVHSTDFFSDGESFC